MSILDRIARIFAARLSEDPRYPEQRRIGYGGRTLAGVLVTPDTAVTVPAVWACLRYLSQTVAVLPWHVMRKGKLGAEVQSSHPVDWLLYKRPNPEWSAFQFRETLVHWALRWGNGYAEIERSPIGVPIALWPIHPERVCAERDETGALVYRVSNGSLGPSIIPAIDMFHIRGFGEGPVGVNVMAYAAESIGWARAAQLFGASFLGQGMNVGTVVQTKGKLGEPGMRRLVGALDRMYKGIRGKRYAVLDAGMEIKNIAIDPEKGQFLETNQFLVAEIARWFGVPPHKIADLSRATFSNIEHQSIEVVVDSVAPWVKRFEEEADFKLFGQNRPAYETKMNMNALLRGDMAARAAFFKAMFDVGAFSPNMILELEDMPTLGAVGDKHLVQLNLTTLDEAGKPTPAPAAPGVGHNGGPPLEDPASNNNAAAMAALARLPSLEPVDVA